MKYSFFSSACAWLPSALMMAVSASGASSAPLASFVRYVPAEMKNKPLSRKTNTEQLGVAFAARGYKHTPENNMANTTLFIYRLEEKLR